MLVCAECVRNFMRTLVRSNPKSKDKVINFINEIEEEAICILDGEPVCTEHLYKELDDSRNWK